MPAGMLSVNPAQGKHRCEDVCNGAEDDAFYCICAPALEEWNGLKRDGKECIWEEGRDSTKICCLFSLLLL